jgi:hypothetical protein
MRLRNLAPKRKARKLKAKEDAKDEAAAEERRNAAKDCAEERAADPDAFAEKWGSDPNKRNAFGKCVSAEARS